MTDEAEHLRAVVGERIRALRRLRGMSAQDLAGAPGWPPGPAARTSAPRPAAGGTIMRTFLIVWAGQFVSQIGGRLSAFALGIWVYQQTGSATLFALITTIALLPEVILAPVAGLVADRFDRRLLMVAGDAGAALCTIALVALLALGRLELWHIYLTQGLAAICAAFQVPAFQASVAQLVPREQLARAAGLNQLADGLSLVLAAPLASVLIGAVGLVGVVALDLASFILTGAAVLAASLAGWLSPRLRRVEAELPRCT